MSDIPKRNDLATRLERLEKMVNDLTRLTVIGTPPAEAPGEVNPEPPPEANQEGQPWS